jgi:hypothetical protein
LVEAAGRASPFIRSYLLEAHPVSLVKDVFTIGFDPEFEDHIGLVDNARNHALLQTKLSELGRPNAQIRFVKAEASAKRPVQTAGPAAPAVADRESQVATPPSPARSGPAAATAAKDKPVPVPFSKDDFKSDPLIQKALEVFKGQIVEVRA